MTSAPVKDVSSLMNFVGGRNLTKTGGTTQPGGFGDLMSKTQSGSSNSQNQTVAGKDTRKTPVADTVRSPKATVKPKETAEKSADELKVEGMTEEQSKVLEEAGNEVIKEIAEELEVSPEEVEEAMEVLGLSVYELFEPSNLRQLVLELEGGADATALLTDENLFAKLQNIINMAADVKADLAGELGIEPKELQALLEEQQNSLKESDIMDGESFADIADSAQMAEKAEEAPKITVEVKAGDETVRLSADEKGNITGVVDAVPSELEADVTKEHAGEHEQKGNGNSRKESEGRLQTGNLQMDALIQNRVQTAEVSFEQTATVFSEQTREIMDQIMDYMKIQLKPGMDQLEMQLHPESLGTVHIQLSSKGGEVTAQFQVQNETVKAAIESQIASLQESLKEQGIKVEAVQVTVENHGFESNLWQGQGREENASSHNNSRKSPRRINLNDLDGTFVEEAGEEELLAAKMMEANGNTVDYTA
ncbi:MAG: hypothetical protein HDQ97_04100 [Lachnospiraceae bacterium]|nr:hypothetical protein [Lachnospiraceae bacterium]